MGGGPLHLALLSQSIRRGRSDHLSQPAYRADIVTAVEQGPVVSDSWTDSGPRRLGHMAVRGPPSREPAEPAGWRSMKTVFTTGEAAKICKVSQQTIIRCFDNGQLKGFRVPGSKFRRIPREALYKFMKDNGIPTDALESGKRKVLWWTTTSISCD